MEGTVANLEKHPKRPIEQVEQADFSDVPMHARSPHVLGSYIKNRPDNVRGRVSVPEHEAPAVILRLEDVPATRRNVERIRERIRLLNRQLAASGTPFRLRMI
jgi:hypothetical protein